MGVAKSYTVLVVDDDHDLLQLLTDGLELIGHFNVIPASNGIEGLEQFFEVHPDCMIIDVKMPGLDGYQLVRALRGDAESAETPIIMLTALAQEQQQFAGLALGADQYLVKPVTPRELVEAVRRAVMIGEKERHVRMEQLLAQSEEAGTDEAEDATEAMSDPKSKQPNR
jgi:two-component system alkaline phosphatase synthesis response regulator PhoP